MPCCIDSQPEPVPGSAKNHSKIVSVRSTPDRQDDVRRHVVGIDVEHRVREEPVVQGVLLAVGVRTNRRSRRAPRRPSARGSARAASSSSERSRRGMRRSRAPEKGPDGRSAGGSPRGSCRRRPSSCTRSSTRAVRRDACARRRSRLGRPRPGSRPAGRAAVARRHRGWRTRTVPSASTRTGTSPKSSLPKPSVSSISGAARSAPSRPYVQP